MLMSNLSHFISHDSPKLFAFARTFNLLPLFMRFNLLLHLADLMMSRSFSFTAGLLCFLFRRMLKFFHYMFDADLAAIFMSWLFALSLAIEQCPIVSTGPACNNGADLRQIKLVLLQEFAESFITTVFHTFEFLRTPLVEVDTFDESDLGQLTESSGAVQTEKDGVDEVGPLFAVVAAVETVRVSLDAQQLRKGWRN